MRGPSLPVCVTEHPRAGTVPGLESKEQTGALLRSPGETGDTSMMLFCSGCHNRTQTGQLKKWKSIFSQFWRLDVQVPGPSRVGIWWGLSSWLIDSHLLSTSSCGLSLVHACGGRVEKGCGERERNPKGDCSSSTHKTTNPYLASVTSCRPCLWLQSQWELGLQHLHFGET